MRLFVATLISLFPLCASAQWVPPPNLRKVRVQDDCARTRHGIGLAIQPSPIHPNGEIFFCQDRAHAIDVIHPGASRFFLVHEYGHLALHTRDEAEADEWAARQLALAAGGKQILQAAVLHFLDEATRFDPLYGSGLDRALRLARAGGLPEAVWPPRLREYEQARAVAMAQGITIRLRLAPGYANRAEMTVFVDNRAVGFLTNRVDEPIVLPPLGAGLHRLSVNDVWLFHLGKDGSRFEIARRLYAETEFRLATSHRLALDLDYDSENLTIAVKAL
jgi:hypothetical protein